MMHRLSTVLASMLCVSLALTGCVSQSTYTAKEQEAQNLNKAVTAAEARNKELTSRVQELGARSAFLESQVNDLTKKYQAGLQQSVR